MASLCIVFLQKKERLITQRTLHAVVNDAKSNANDKSFNNIINEEVSNVNSSVTTEYLTSEVKTAVNLTQFTFRSAQSRLNQQKQSLMMMTEISFLLIRDLIKRKLISDFLLKRLIDIPKRSIIKAEKKHQPIVKMKQNS